MKIGIKDLRIGIFVEMECDGKKFNTKIDVGDFMDINRGYKIVYGIPLTEEVILKLGFERKSFYVLGAGSSFKWQLDNFIFLKDFSGNFYLPTMPKNIVFYYLHQLQNFYYYMNNGQELNTSELI